jgi:hypothetical protein
VIDLRDGVEVNDGPRWWLEQPADGRAAGVERARAYLAANAGVEVTFDQMEHAVWLAVASAERSSLSHPPEILTEWGTDQPVDG